MSNNKTCLILPLLVFTKYENGKYEIIIGWLKKTYSITYGSNNERQKTKQR